MNDFWTKLLDTFTLHQQRMKWVILGVCCLSVLGAAGIITWYCVANHSVPDVETADVQRIVNYIKSDQFLNKSSIERGEYIEKFMARYERMSPDEQRAAQDILGKTLRKNRKAEKTIALSFAAKQADVYSKLKTPDEKDQFIDRWLTMMEMTHGGYERARQEYQKRKLGGQHNRTPEKRKESISRLRKNLPLVMSRTSARDRAKLAKLARDASQRIQERYGR